MNYPPITHVAAVDTHFAIGKNNQIAWYIPADFQHFKRITTGGVVIMGRKTFESIGKPLPNRTNIVITRDTTWGQDTKDILTANSIENAIMLGAKNLPHTPKKCLFVIGGEQIYRQTLSLATTLEITHVITDIKDPDAFYPAIPKGFVQVFCSDVRYDDKSGIGFYFATYKKSP